MSKKIRSDRGKVVLIGGGPGDPGLLTLKGRSWLQKAEVLIYDALINPDLLNFCKKSAEKIFVGKRRHLHSYEQDEINQLLLKQARDGKIVCRLKGGDPFLFGRGGEEVEFLEKHGISWELIPGVSSALAVPAMAGIPLTHRDYASLVTITTGHSLHLQLTYEPRKSLVVLMGFSKLSDLVKNLLRSGWPKSSSIALICSGTLPNQTVVTGTLSTIISIVRKSRKLLSSPALIVVGDVVQFRNKILKPYNPSKCIPSV